MGIFQGFVNPLLAWGVGLAAIPLLIHLFNRRRHRPLPWAAMRFVLAAYRKTRRRVQLENLLLLLLRMGAVALLALAVSRPFIGSDSPLAPLTERRRDLVLVLDASASTSYREGVQSVYEREIERARALLAELDGTRGDRVRLLHAAENATLLTSHSPEEALLALSTLSAPRDEPLRLERALAEVVELASEDAGSSGQSALEVRLLTDLQRSNFEPPAGAEVASGEPAPPAPLTGALDRLAELGVGVVVEDLGPDSPYPPNLGLLDVEPLEPLLGAGLASEIGVSVRNHGGSGRGGVRVALSVDGVRQPSQKIDLAARGSTQARFQVVFGQPGHHSLVAEIDGDRMARDDTRATIVDVPAPLRVLLVDGDPHDEIDRDEVGYLRAVLEPPDDGGLITSPAGRYAPFETQVVTSATFAGPELTLNDQDVVVLANLASLPTELVTRLEGWVARGGALLVTLGDRSSDGSALDTLNDRLWRADASGLLPARLSRHVAVSSRYGNYFRAVSFDEQHPALSFFADERWRAFLTEIPIYEFVACDPLERSQVLISLDDEEHSPLLVERDYDRGHVLLWTSSIDGDWNLLPQSPATMIPLMHELLRSAGTPLRSSRNAAVGDSPQLELDSFPRQAALVAPDGSRRALDGEPLEVAEGVWRLPPAGPLSEAGLWHIESESGRPIELACRMQPGEGDLARMSPEELESAHPTWRFYRPGEGDSHDEDEPADRGELWRWFAGTALLFLVLETLWAAWIGRGRRIA